MKTNWKDYQKYVRALTEDVFGEEAMRPKERVLRCFEEVSEACQALHIDYGMLIGQLSNTYNRPREQDLEKELGGVAWTLIALIESCGYNFSHLVSNEDARISAPEHREALVRRHKEKIHPYPEYKV